MARPSGSAAALLRRAGLVPVGPVPWGAPVPVREPGVYVVELAPPRASAPLDHRAIRAWRRALGTVTVDGVAATDAALATRLGGFWIPSATVMYIGQASGPVRGRVSDYYRTPLGARSPHSGGYWAKTLSCLSECAVWGAATDDYDAAEAAILDDFVRTVPRDERLALHDPSLVLPFANLKDGHGRIKGHRIGGARLT